MSFYFFTGVKKSQAILQIVLFFYWGKKIPDDFADRFIFLLG